MPFRYHPIAQVVIWRGDPTNKPSLRRVGILFSAGPAKCYLIQAWTTHDTIPVMTYTRKLSDFENLIDAGDIIERFDIGKTTPWATMGRIVEWFENPNSPVNDYQTKSGQEFIIGLINTLGWIDWFDLKDTDAAKKRMKDLLKE